MVLKLNKSMPGKSITHHFISTCVCMCEITANRCIQVVIKPINPIIYTPLWLGTHVRMEKAASKRNKRSSSFTAEEMAVLVDEVWQHCDVLFGGTKGKKDIALKNRIWQAIAQNMSPSSP